MTSKSARGSEEQVRKSFLFLSWTALLCLISSQAFLAHALEGQTPLVSKVDVLVDRLPDGEGMADLISIRPGDPYSLNKVTHSIKQIYRTGLFSDIQVLKSGEDKIELRYLLTRKLIARRIRFEGEKGIRAGKLRQSLYSLRSENYFTEDKLNRAEEELRQTLAGEGYFHPVIKTSVEKIPEKQYVDIVFDVSAGQRYVVAQIEFQGGGVFSAKDLEKKMKSREGKEYIPSRLERDINAIKDRYVKQGFRRAEVELAGETFDELRKTVSLTLQITPQERIQIDIRGAKAPSSLVEPIWEERVFEEWGLVEGEAKILSYLRGKGYLFCSVKSSIQKSDSEIHIIHEVDPGKKYKIRDVAFEGISFFTPEELREKLEISEKILFFGVIDGKEAFDLTRAIRALYQTRGFSGVSVDLDFIRAGKDVIAKYIVNEGEQQKIISLSLNGATQIGPETLLQQMSIVQDGPYFAPSVQREVEKLQAFYLNQGFRGTIIDSNVSEEEENKFAVTFDIQEGKRVKIEKILISGNIATREKTIQRELRFSEENYAYHDSITLSERNLARLGVFSDISIEEIPVSTESEYVVVNLKEGQKNYVGLGLGLETKGTPWLSSVGIEDIRLRGTAEYMRSNIFGRASNLSFIAQFSIKEKRGVISWESPYFVGIPVDTYLNAWLEEEDRVSFGFEREGVSLSWIKSFPKDWTSLISLGYSRTVLTKLEIPPSEVDRVFFPYSTSSISGTLIREKRNDVFNPETGYFGSMALEWAFPYLGTESDFLKSFFKYQHFFPFGRRLSFSTTFRLGLGRGKMPIHERFFAGGSSTFRGREFDQLGPKDPLSGKPIGGKALILFNFETTFPLLPSLRNLAGAVFYDVGNVFFDRSDFDLSALEHAVGFGVRYKTPLGPLRFELGWNLTVPQREGKPIFFLSIGHVF